MADGLLLYRDAGSSTYVAYTPGSTYIETTHDCELGETQELQLFLRNDDNSLYFTDISIRAESLTSLNDVIGVETGWGVKLYSGATQPTEAEWEIIDYGNSISMTDIGATSSPDTTTYLPLWFRIECPAGITPTIKENIALHVEYESASV